MSEAESSLLFTGHAATEFPRGDVSLFSITERLRARWWNLAETGMGSTAGGDDWVTTYAREVTEFARFKGLPLPPTCSFKVVISSAGQLSTRTDDSADIPRLAGLSLSSLPPYVHLGGAPADPMDGTRVLGGINLGDEPTSIVFINLSPRHMAEQLLASGLEVATNLTPTEVVRNFLSRFSAYPLIRLAINPAEGFWLPDDGIVFDGYTLDQTGMAVLLVFQARD